MVPSSERTLLITIRVRVDHEVSTGPVITVRRHELTGPNDAEETAVTHSPEAALGVVRDWLSEFSVAE